MSSDNIDGGSVLIAEVPWIESKVDRTTFVSRQYRYSLLVKWKGSLNMSSGTDIKHAFPATMQHS